MPLKVQNNSETGKKHMIYWSKNTKLQHEKIYELQFDAPNRPPVVIYIKTSIPFYITPTDCF